MGAPDITIKNYLKDNWRFADLFNACLFNGKQQIKENELSDHTSMLSKTVHGRLTGHARVVSIFRDRDVTKEFLKNTKLVVYAVENLDYIDYGIVPRCMEYEAMEYMEQVNVISEKYQKKSRKKSVRLSGLEKKDKLAPVITLVVYYGKEKWDGSGELFGLLDIPEELSYLKPYITNYKINLFDYHNFDQFDLFQSDLREVFGFLKHSQKKEELLQEIGNHKERYAHLNQSCIDVIEVLTNTNLLSEYINKEEREDIDMCEALEELVRDSRKEGEEKREAKTIRGTINLLRRLNHSDNEIRKEIIEEFSMSPETADNYLKI